LKSKKENGPKISFQCLFYPAVNMSTIATDSAKCFGKGYLLTNKAMVTFRSFYLPNSNDWTNPYASPLQAKDLAGMPPALITTAGCDPLLSDGEAYSKRLSDAGVKVTYMMEKNIFHGYLGLLNINPVVSPLAEKTLDYAANVIRDNLR
jgi:acetyl esterase